MAKADLNRKMGKNYYVTIQFGDLISDFFGDFYEIRKPLEITSILY